MLNSKTNQGMLNSQNDLPFGISYLVELIRTSSDYNLVGLEVDTNLMRGVLQVEQAPTVRIRNPPEHMVPDLSLRWKSCNEFTSFTINPPRKKDPKPVASHIEKTRHVREQNMVEKKLEIGQIKSNSRQVYIYLKTVRVNGGQNPESTTWRHLTTLSYAWDQIKVGVGVTLSGQV